MGWIAQASAQGEGRQIRRRVSLLNRSLRDALLDVCRWRAAATGDDPAQVLTRCWAEMPSDLLDRLKADGVQV